MTTMSTSELDNMLSQTLEDRRLSRSERRAVREVFADMELDQERRAFIRHRVFALAREAIRGADDQAVLDWAEDVIKLLVPEPKDDQSTVADACFSPGDQCRLRITQLIQNARKSVDICVFTITDDRLVEPIIDAHRRGVALRIVTDNDKAEDRGSDAYRLGRAGVPVRVDRSEHHMHHKYAIFDRRIVLTGSYNWTRSAAQYNRENIIVSDDPNLAAPFQRNFDELWLSLGPSR